MLILGALLLIILIIYSLGIKIFASVLIKNTINFILANFPLILAIFRGDKKEAECMYTEKKPSPGQNSEEALYNTTQSMLHDTNNITAQPNAYQAYTVAQGAGTIIEIQGGVIIAQNISNPVNQIVGSSLVMMGNAIKQSSKYPNEGEAKEYLKYEEEKKKIK